MKEEQGSKVNIKTAATSQTNATNSRNQHTTMTLVPQQNNGCCQTTRNRRRSSPRKRVEELAICAVGMRGFTLSGTMLGRFLWVRQHPHETRSPGFPLEHRTVPRPSFSSSVLILWNSQKCSMKQPHANIISFFVQHEMHCGFSAPTPIYLVLDLCDKCSAITSSGFSRLLQFKINEYMVRGIYIFSIAGW